MINNSTLDAIYVRKSRKDLELEQQGEGETLSRHLKILEDLSKKLSIVIKDEDIYKEVVSGESIEARPEMQKLLKKVENGYYRSVLVVEIERLARGDSIDQGIILRAFKLSDTKIITPAKTYNFKQETDEEYMEFGLFMSRREYKVITKRLQRGRNLSAKEGKFVGSKPAYGYERIKLEHDKGYSLKINDQKANTVKLIFNMYTNDLINVPNICRHLNSLSIPSPSDGKWTPDAIRRILKNPVYAGFIRYNNRVTTTNVKDGKVCTSYLSNKGKYKDFIFTKGLHSPIISEELFYKTSDIIKKKYIPPTNKPLKNPLSGLVKCKCCGKTLATSISRGEKRLYCKTIDCENKSINIKKVEEKVILYLEEWLKNKEVLCLNNNDNLLETKSNLLLFAKEELKKQINKKEHIYDLFEEGIYNKDMFFERNTKVTASIDELNIQISNLQSDITQLQNINNEKENYIPNLKSVLENYKKSTDTKQKNYLLKSVIDKIYYLKTEKRKSMETY